MSFRSRLILAVAAAVAVAVAVASMVTYLIVRSELRGEVDDALSRRAEIIRREPIPMVDARVGSGGDVFVQPVPEPFLGGAGGYIQVVSDDGGRFLGAGESIELPVTDSVLAVASGESEAFFRDATVAGTHVRILTAPLAPGLAIQLTRPLDEVDGVLGRLQLVLVLVGLAGIGVAAALALGVARTAITPVRRLTEAAEHIARTRDLGSRVDAHTRDELGRLGASFNTMFDALESSTRAQRRLVSDASHELRTPLTSLRTNVEVLARDRDLPALERERVRTDVLEQVEELTTLLDEVVELARGQELELDLEDVRLDLLVGEAIERARRHRPDVQIEATLEPIFVRAAPPKLSRAIGNLLDNAVKWNSAAAPVEVVVRDGEVVVRDHGPGIDEADLPYIFDRFYRADSARALPGAGLGLAIVRQVAEAHGGKVAAERAEGGGSLFRFTIPVIS